MYFASKVLAPHLVFLYAPLLMSIFWKSFPSLYTRFPKKGIIQICHGIVQNYE